MSSRQLTFPLGHEVKFTAEDFLPAPANEAAYRIVTAWPVWPARGLVLCGPHGSGKSHLAAIWAEQAGAAIWDADGIDQEMLEKLAPDSRIVVENLDISGGSEDILFHFMNVVRERNLWALLTASQQPNPTWPKLPDLASRLRQLPLAELGAPDDALVRAVLVKLFHDRQLAVDAEVVDYVARRMERSLGAARDVVAALDEEALALGRRVTKPMAAAVLARLAPETDAE